ncbi:MAG: tRNA-binding protein [Streptomycetales bacterium]
MPEHPDGKPEIDAGQFFAVDMRVGRVTEVAPFPEARRPAAKIRVDFGPLGERHTSAQVIHYPADELYGRMVIGAVNLGAKRIAGFRSEFLLLGAIGDDGVVRLLQPDAGARPGDPVA